MSACGTCRGKLDRKDIKVFCIGQCSCAFHLKCVGLADDAPTEDWTCQQCIMGEVVRNNMKDLRDQVKILQDKVDTLVSDIIPRVEKLERESKSTRDLIPQILELEKEVKSLVEEREELKKEVKSLREEHNHDQQYNRKMMFEIRELQETPGEDLHGIVSTIAEKLTGEQVKRQEIQAVHRLPAREGKTPAVIVELSRREIRDKIVFSKRKASLTNPLLLGRGSGRVFVGENLSPHFRKLLGKAKEKAKVKGWKHVWYSKFEVRAKKDSEDKIVIRMRTEDDLQKIR